MTNDSRETDAGSVLRAIERLAGEKLGWSGRLERPMRLVEDLELDSIRNLTLAIEIENHFRIALSEEDERAVETVGDLVDVIERQLDRRGAGRGSGR